MKNHDDIRKLLPAYCSGDLEPAERMRVEEHLNSCPECSAALADLETTLRLIRSTPRVEPPPWMTSRIMARLREETAVKRSWLQRIFFPLHIKLPLEFVALLMVCVSGYFLARHVETEIQRPVPQLEEAPAPSKVPEAPAQAQKTPARSEKPSQPTQAIIEKKTERAPGRKPVQEPAPAPKPTTRPVSPPVAEPSAPRAPSTYAPAPPAHMQERSKSAPSINIDVQSEAPRAQSYDRAENTESTMKENTAKRLKKQKSESAKAVQLPRLRLRLSIDDPATAGEAIRQVVNRSGGTLVNGEQAPSGRHLKTRIPAARLPELVGRLERLGSIAEQPAMPDSEGLVEVDIVW
jgi:hypothetical protein